MKSWLVHSLIVLALALLPHSALSQSSCAAQNENGDQRCSISCPAGQSASCSDATGSNAPSCTCAGISENLKVKSSLFALRKGQIFEAMDFVAPSPSPIEDTDLISVINTKLATLPDYHLRDSCSGQLDQSCWLSRFNQINAFPGDPAFRVALYEQARAVCTRNVCQPVSGKLTVQGPLNVSAGPTVKVDTPNWDDIPADVDMHHQTYKNCSAVQQSDTFTHSVTRTVGDQITKTHVLTTGSSQTVQISAGLKIGIANFGGSDTLAFSSQTQITDSSMDSHTEQKTDTISLPLIVPPMTLLDLKHSFIQYRVPIPFSGTIAVDGQVSSNLAGISQISSVLPNASDRIFTFSGIVTDSTLLDATTETHQKTLTANDCTDSEKAKALVVTSTFSTHF